MSYSTTTKMLIPNHEIDLYKWAVVACDQYTSQPEYWEKTEQIVGDAPSTLHLILPEVYLCQHGDNERIHTISSTMEKYLQDGTLIELPEGMILTERTLPGNRIRKGIMIAVDLEEYDYAENACCLIRPTEKTVVERIPPRIAVRNAASLELPHIMLLADDVDRTIIEPIYEARASLHKLYDTDLMQEGGHLRGWFLPKGNITDQIISSIDRLHDSESFREKYHLNEQLPVLSCVVGDGNHSLATAKSYWEQIKQSLPEGMRTRHPARYCLCELVNLYDESITFEPIHRVLFGVDSKELLEYASRFYLDQGCECGILPYGQEPEKNEHRILYHTEHGIGTLTVKKPCWELETATLQAFLDRYLESHSDARIDYVHGDSVAEELGKQHGNISFIVPTLAKEDLFRSVILNGVLPRKTFSIGAANEKRFYMEARLISE